MRAGTLHESQPHAVSPPGPGDVQIVEDENRPRANRGERWVELHEADGGLVAFVGQCDEDYRLTALQTVADEPERELRIARLVVELAVGIEQRRDERRVLRASRDKTNGHKEIPVEYARARRALRRRGAAGRMRTKRAPVQRHTRLDRRIR